MRDDWAYALGCGAIVLLLTVLAVDPSTQGWPLTLYPVPLVLLWLARKRLAPAFLSPACIATLVFLAIGVAGWWGGAQTASVGGFDADPSQIARTCHVLGIAAIGVALGAWLSSFRFVADEPVTIAPVSEVSDRAIRWLLLASTVPLLIFVLKDGHALVLRATYLQGVAGDYWVTLATGLATAAVGVLGFVFASGTTFRRLVAVALFAGYFVVFFGLGSRRLALLPLIFALGVYAGRRSRGTRVFLLIAVALGILLLPLPLFDRGLPTDGISPYFHAVIAYPGTAFSQSGTLANALSPFPVTAATIASPVTPAHWLLIELDPLPGHLSGWYGISASLRVNSFVPYSGVGEVALHGPWFALAFWTGAGIVLTYLDRRVRYYLGSGQQPVAIALTGLAGLFALLSIEYNLRAASRMVVYAIALDLVIRAIKHRPRVQSSFRSSYSRAAYERAHY